MPKTKWDWMAYTASAGGQVAFIIELVDICRTKNGDKLSWPFTILGLMASVMGLVYGLKNKLKPLILISIFDVILAKIVYFKDSYDYKNEEDINHRKNDLPSKTQKKRNY